MALLDIVKATLGTKTYFFRSKADAYDGLESDLGVELADDADKDEPLYKTEELQGKGLIFRLTCGLENGKRREVFCVRDKLQTALDALPGKTMDGSKVISAIVSRKARFS